MGEVYDEPPIVKASFGALKVLFTVAAVIFGAVVVVAIYLLVRSGR